MPSPFPGMNPYLEQEDVWQDFHASFMPLARAALTEQVRPGYVVKVEEHLFLHELPYEDRHLIGRAHVSVAIESGTVHARDVATEGAVTAPAYGIIPARVDVERHPFLEIRDRMTRELVTVVELLSPSNKRAGPDRESYLAKRLKILNGTAHLVEIDLLRGGPRLPLEGLPECDYCAMVSRAEERPRAGIWPIVLEAPLPDVPIPLRLPDPDATLRLQPLLHELYDSAAYGDYIFRSEPQLPLEKRRADWARSLASSAT